jgi:hypothetical protein
MQTETSKNELQKSPTQKAGRRRAATVISLSCLPVVIAVLLTQSSVVRFVVAFVTLPSIVAFGVISGWVWHRLIRREVPSEDSVDTSGSDKQENWNTVLAFIFGLGCFASAMLMYTHRMVRDFWHLWFNGR